MTNTHATLSTLLQNSFRYLFGVLAACLCVCSANAKDERIIRVGPQQEIRSISVAAAAAKDGDVVEIEAGEYVGDVAVWTQARLTIRAVGGMAVLKASGAAAENKAIWVIRGGYFQIENIQFSGAKVADRNGAGIRLEKGIVLVRNCIFTDNENGILTANNANIELEIENSEFGNNGAGDGQSHNVYVGAIGKLKVTGSYFHHARVGHLLKSRAAFNWIAYNRLTDEIGGKASYELEFPGGGVAYVIGNIIQQSSTTENPNLISFGAEGYKGATHELYLINNTLVDNRPQGGVFLKVAPGNPVIKAYNNLLMGKGTLEAAAPGDYRNNLAADLGDFALAVREDFRLKTGSRYVGKGIAAGSANGFDLNPTLEYVHPRRTQNVQNPARQPGAMQSLFKPN